MQNSPATAMADLRARINANLHRGSAQSVRALFEENNPQLVGDKRFESRWSTKRRDAAVLIPLIDRPQGWRVILTVRSSDMPSHAGQISFPGGKTGPEDDGPTATALREAHEEVNISPDEVDIIGALGVHQGGIGFSVTPVIGIVDARAQLRPCPREVGEIFEVPIDFIADLNNHITEERILDGAPYNIQAAPYGRFHIWGLTAAILRSFADVIQDEPGR